MRQTNRKRGAEMKKIRKKRDPVVFRTKRQMRDYHAELEAFELLQKEGQI